MAYGESSKSPDYTSKPTILAFHGSGSNGECHDIQLLRLKRFCEEHVIIESLTAPFPSQPGPGVLPFFADFGPFARWLPREQISLDAMRAGTGTSSMPPEVEDLVRTTVTRIRAAGGRVVGLMGFSQGTKIVAGLLRASEVLDSIGRNKSNEWCNFKFGVSVCSSFPPPVFPLSIRAPMLDKKIRSPCYHVIGKQDEWNWAGMVLVEKHFEVGEEMAVVAECEVGHQYPLKKEETEAMWRWMEAQLKRVGT